MERNEDRSREREGVGSTEGLPPPPPDPSALPLPPPPQSLAQTRQQRQINELKRLYRHMRPELRKNMELVLSEEWGEVLDAERVASGATAETPDLSPPGEVQSMRWIFENWPLDIIGDHQTAKRLREEETVPLGDVRGTSQMFEAQNLTETGDQRSETPRVERGDVRTALWLFETQPMDSLNKVSTEEGELQEAVLREREAIPGGDVSGARLLFETQPLHRVGRSGSAEERSVLQLRSEIQELSGGVSRTVGLFETEPLCAIREPGGVMHRVRSVCREEIQHSDQAKSARWLFETQPLGDISGGEHSPMVRVVRGISLEEEAGRGTGGVGVGRARWLFETQPLDAIRERSSELAEECENIKVVEGGDVRKWRSLFESKPLDSRPPGEGEGEEVGGETREAVTGGDVRSTLWLFETQPMDSLRDSFEVGQLRRVVTEEEKGDVKQKAREFESRPLEVTRGQPGEEKEEAADVRKGDVKAYQRLFESLPLDGIKEPGGEMVAIRSQVIGGNVRESRALFENPPRYAIADGAGGYHQVRTVSREEEEAMGSGGDVRNYRWVFETQPLDRQGCEEAQLVKGITKEEAWVGDVGTARWLFETQPLRGLAPDAGGETEEQRKSGGEVKTCRWLFETPLADARLERAQREADTAPGTGGDVRRWTWLFETPEVPGESASGERSLKVTGRADSDTGTAKHLFDSEPVVVGGGGVRYTSKVDVRSGDVSREKEIFERSSLDAIGEEARSGDGEEQGPEPGAVRRFTWLFENRPMDAIGEMDARPASSWAVADVAAGDVGGKRFVFETRSLDRIGGDEPSPSPSPAPALNPEPGVPGGVRSRTMLFESRPLYAIRDREGLYHEVTTVKKDEVVRGDVRGARWLFETKPLDSIRPSDEVFVIRAVTQEDVHRGDVTAARWRFETQPLGSIGDQAPPPSARMVEEVQGGDVSSGREIFEQEPARSYVRTVSVSDIQSGDVRTSTWQFENLPIDSLKGSAEESEGQVSTVHREDVEKGDVKRCTWLFESRRSDGFGDAGAGQPTREDVPPGDVKSTTWLFETTPLDAFQQGPGRQEVGPPAGQSVRSSLRSLCAAGAVRSGGLAIESCRVGTVSMVKYRVAGTDEGTNRGCVGEADILKEEVIHGNLQRILVELLDKTNVAPQGILLREDKDGRISSAKVQFFSRPQPGAEQEAAHSPDLRVIHDLLRPGSSVKKGILIQESGKGEAEMTVYSLLDRAEAQTETRGRAENGKSMVGSLPANNQEQPAPSLAGQQESGKSRNVQLIASCVDAGDLDSLKKEEPVQEKEKVEEKVAQRRFEEIPGTVNTKEVRGTKVSSVACSLAPEIQGAGEARVKLGRSAHVHRAHRPCLGPAVTVSRGEDSGLQDGASGASEQQLQVAMEGMREATAQAQAHGRSSQHRAGVGPSPALSPSRSQQVSEIAGDRGGGGGGGLGRPTVPATARCQSHGASHQAASAQTVSTSLHGLGRLGLESSALGVETGSVPGLGRGLGRGLGLDLGLDQSLELGPGLGPEHSLPRLALCVQDRRQQQQQQQQLQLQQQHQQYPALASSSSNSTSRPEADTPPAPTPAPGRGPKPKLPPKPAHLQDLPRRVSNSQRKPHSLNRGPQPESRPQGLVQASPAPMGLRAEEEEFSSKVEAKTRVPRTPLQMAEEEHRSRRREGENVALNKEGRETLLREPKARGRETEKERRKRLSLHKEEIERGHVEAAMDIFESLRRREELQKILTSVGEFEEGETSRVDVRALRSLFEEIPEWVVGSKEEKTVAKGPQGPHGSKTEAKGVEDTPSPSVRVVFQDLERASSEVIRLKEQTLAKLVEIEDSIQKALRSVSSLRSEADIAGLSGLFRESLDSETPAQRQGRVRVTPALEVPSPNPRVLVPSPSSPSYISIQSAARKPDHPLKWAALGAQPPTAPPDTGRSPLVSPASPKPPPLCNGAPLDPASEGVPLSAFKGAGASCPRSKSVVEFNTGSAQGEIIGTTIVTEEYQQIDSFGHKLVTSKTSTTVTKQSESQPPPNRYHQLTPSPSSLLQPRCPSVRAEEPGPCPPAAPGIGVVFLSFGNPTASVKR
eukprot:gi/632987586/ref/XP_007882637.1/ PREDICTED: xin actin-binding repeat-containing protein 1-like [Callorhinchus milii]